MHSYLLETEYAVQGLFALIRDEEAKCGVVRTKIQNTQDERLRAQAILLYGAPHSGFGEDTTSYFEKKVRDARRTIAALEAETVQLEASLAVKAFSVRSIAGAILQIAKQGIVIAHGSLTNCPTGRIVGAEALRNVIWQARNQAMHWEEGTFRSPVLACFASLESSFGATLRLEATSPTNLAKEILDILGWHSYPEYIADMVRIIQ